MRSFNVQVRNAGPDKIKYVHLSDVFQVEVLCSLNGDLNFASLFTVI